MCLIKGILAHYTVLLSQQPPAPPFAAMPNANGRVNGANNNNASANTDNQDPSPEELDAARTREITAKAVSGIMLLLLKWLKLSRKFTSTLAIENPKSLTRYATQISSNSNS